MQCYIPIPLPVTTTPQKQPLSPDATGYAKAALRSHALAQGLVLDNNNWKKSGNVDRKLFQKRWFFGKRVSSDLEPSTLDLGNATYKVLVIGDAGVGKTSIVQRYVHGFYTRDYRATLGVDFALKVIHWSNNVSIKLQLWDIAGQERFTSMTRVYYKDAHACIIMFDLTQRNTFLNALKWKKDLDSKCSLPDGSPIPCILLANKCDLHHREVDQSEIEEFCKDKAFIGWTETSVKEGLMIDDSMKFLLEDMVSRYSINEPEEGENEMNGRSSNITLRRSSGDSTNEDSKCACSV